MTTSLGSMVRLDVPFEEAVARTREALESEGFGVLTEIDIQAAFREKLGREFRRYIILGACHPQLAHRALTAEPEVGLLLPCNVTVEADPSGATVVRLVEPLSMLGVGGLSASPEVGSVAAEAHQRLERVAATLASATSA